MQKAQVCKNTCVCITRVGNRNHYYSPRKRGEEESIIIQESFLAYLSNKIWELCSGYLDMKKKKGGGFRMYNRTSRAY